jgi:hypothetical protein
MKLDITLKHILIAAIVVASIFTFPAYAQGGQEIIINIPFAFSVNRLHFEAGSYKFNQTSDEFGMYVVSLRTGKKQYITARPQDSSLSPNLGFLVFSQTGENQYLSEVHFPGTVGYSRLNIPKQRAD